MKAAAAVLAAVGLCVATGVSAQSGEDLIKKNGCTACHAIDKKVIGPAYVDVAAKYKGDAKAPAALMKKVKEGGSGVWGDVPMPPHPTLDDALARALVGWILGGAL